MGFDNPIRPWSELERLLDGRPARAGNGRQEPEGDGGDGPAFSRHRGRYLAPSSPPRSAARVPYAELHCHSNFSFLDGASHPEQLVEEALRLGLQALALTDHDGFYGVVRFAEAAAELGMPTVFGAELGLGEPAPGPSATGASATETGAASQGRQPRSGPPDPPGEHLLLLARDLTGYRHLSSVIGHAQLAGGQKDRPAYDRRLLAELAQGQAAGHWLALTGCRKGAVRTALQQHGPEAAAAELGRLVEVFGSDNVVVELTDHGHPGDSDRNDALAGLAASAGLPVVATTAAHYATPSQSRTAAGLAAVRARRSLTEADGWLPAGPGAHLRSGQEMARRFDRYPGAVAAAARLGTECAVDLNLIAPQLPPFDTPPGHTEDSWLAELTYAGARARYGEPAACRVPGAYEQIAKELRVITDLGFAGYFLVVHDIVRFCRDSNILCQGRGSAANSAVCYALGVTNVDAVSYGLLFERFLAPERDGPPDIDVDIESGRREEAIQHVYEKYGRHYAAQVANVISYRPKSAVRDAARALGYAPGQADAWSKQIERWSSLQSQTDTDIPADVVAMADATIGFPRHLGVHSGGMVICDRPVIEVCPVEWATAPGRTVLQWDKDDCAGVGLVKFDLLGLGMLEALHGMIDLVTEHHGVEVDLAQLPQQDAVYDMLCRADSVGVFQVESRAQMATLPRLRPRTFYDLVVEVALIRPGPIQGGSVHPYIRRRNGLEPVRYAHPLLERSLAKTYGVPLFQEQLMQMASDVAGFTGAEADALRRAMGAKRSDERMSRLRQRLFDGMAARGITGEVAEGIYDKLRAFAHFGFPESHSVSFALLVYASAWFKLHYPAAFLAALLAAQPMGFYSPQTLVADARRHQVVVRTPDVLASAVQATLEPVTSGADVGTEQAVRLGLASVRGIGTELAEQIVQQRQQHGPFRSQPDLASRVALSAAQLESLATAGAFEGLGLDRRQALWGAGAAAALGPDRLPGLALGSQAPVLPGMEDLDLAAADVWATGISIDRHPVRFLRQQLQADGVLPANRLAGVRSGTRVEVGGVVTHRQRPATAGGVTFVNLEDETGMINVVCSPGVWARYRRVARSSSALLVRGTLENAESVVNLVADRLRPLPLGVATTSRDFR